VDVIVATPGRLLDFVNRELMPLDRLHYLVFDEVDRMLTNYYPAEVRELDKNTPPQQQQQQQQLGPMEDQLRNFLSKCNLCPRQTSMFSATIPPAVERLARSALLNEIIIQIGEPVLGNGKSADTVAMIPKNITQNVIFLNSYQKKKLLLETLRKTESPPVLIFSDSITTVDWVVGVLKQEQFHVAGLHSDKSQGYRFRVMKGFKEGQLDVLVATDVSSRGIDVVDVSHVILYDMPDHIETYIHRIGRCGRAGQESTATSFLTYHCKCAKELRILLKKNKQMIPPQLEDLRMFGHKVVQTELGDKVIFE